MIGGKRKLSKWNKFVQKIYANERRKNKNFQFKDALKMASAMKKKGQYGGEGEEIEEIDQEMIAKQMGGEDESMVDDEIEDFENIEMEGGRRRRRTRRRRRGSRRTRTRGRTRRHRRSHRGGQLV